MADDPEMLCALVDLVQEGLASLSSDQSRKIFLARIARLGPAEAPVVVLPGSLLPMADEEADVYGRGKLAFGRNEGERRMDCLEYLAWLADLKRAEWQELWRYLANPRVAKALADEMED